MTDDIKTLIRHYGDACADYEHRGSKAFNLLGATLDRLLTAIDRLTQSSASVVDEALVERAAHAIAEAAGAKIDAICWIYARAALTAALALSQSAPQQPRDAAAVRIEVLEEAIRLAEHELPADAEGGEIWVVRKIVNGLRALAARTGGDEMAAGRAAIGQEAG